MAEEKYKPDVMVSTSAVRLVLYDHFKDRHGCALKYPERREGYTLPPGTLCDNCNDTIERLIDLMVLAK
jgi:hypothetical protein